MFDANRCLQPNGGLDVTCVSVRCESVENTWSFEVLDDQWPIMIKEGFTIQSGLLGGCQ